MSDTEKQSALHAIVSQVVVEVFSEMMSFAVAPLDSPPAASIEGDRVVGSVGFGGEESGVVCLHVSEEFSRRITAAILSLDPGKAAGAGEVNDAIGELTSVIAGNIKARLYGKTGTSTLSIPSIIRGTHVLVETVRVARREHFAFRHKDQLVLVELYLKAK